MDISARRLFILTIVFTINQFAGLFLNGQAVADGVRTKQSLQFSAISKEEKSVVASWISDIDIFTELYPQHAYVLTGSYTSGRRPTPETLREQYFHYLYASSHKLKATRQFLILHNLKQSSDNNSDNVTAGQTHQKLRDSAGMQIVSSIGENKDFLQLDGIAKFGENGQIFDVPEKNIDAVRQSIQGDAILDPIIDLFSIIPIARQPHPSINEILNENRMRGITRKGDITYVRWIFPDPMGMHYGLTFGFKQERPVIVFDEFGMGKDDSFKPLYSQGYNEIEWRQFRNGVALPVKIRKVLAIKPEQRKLNAVDKEWDISVNWFLDNTIPVEFFGNTSVGNLELGKYLPK
jgi:hypothetical protein